jgi:hypothetical protein
LKNFVKRYKDGQLKRFFRSAGAPKDNSGPIKIIVSKTYEQMVLDPTKEVFVMYWMPKCEECKIMNPHWKNLAEEVRGIDDLVIGKYNTMDNENEGLNIDTYPTLMFYGKDNKEGIPCTGKTLDSLKRFLLEHSAALKVAMERKAKFEEEQKVGEVSEEL